MATLKSIPKAKDWYKHIKVGDKVLVQLHPNHTWYHNIVDEQLVATVTAVYRDGTFSCETEKSLSPFIPPTHKLLIGPAGTDWEEDYPATILRKVK